MTRGTPMHGRMKFAAQTAVELAGGVDGAAATTSRARSTAGRWLSGDEPDLPTIDSAVAMDKAALNEGKRAVIGEAYAREIGRVLVALPHARASREDWHAKAAELTREHGDLLSGLLLDLSDRKISKSEATKRRRDVADLIAIAVEIDMGLVEIEEGEG